MVLNSQGFVALSEVYLAAPTSSLDFAKDGHPEPPRGLLTDLWDVGAVERGLGPLMTVRLTRFADQTSALGVCLSHALCDGYGAYTVLLLFARALSLRYSTRHSLRCVVLFCEDCGVLSASMALAE